MTQSLRRPVWKASFSEIRQCGDLLGKRVKSLSIFLPIFILGRFASLATFIVLRILSLLLNNKNPQPLHLFPTSGFSGEFCPKITVLYFFCVCQYFLSFQFIFSRKLFVKIAM